jgi:hypothetical protein
VAVDLEVGVVGVKQALKDLNKIAPTLRRQITKDYAQIVEPMIKTAHQAIPQIAPVTGMDRTGWKTRSGLQILPPAGWNGTAATKALKPKINTRRIKEFRGNKENVGTFGVVWRGFANTVFDMAGRKSSGNKDVFSRMGSHGRMVGAVGGPHLLAILQGRYGSASRTVWPSYERNQNEIDNQMQKLVDEVMRLANSDLSKPTSVGG